MFLHFYICHQSGSLLAKKRKRGKKKELKFLQAEFLFFLALSDQKNLLGANCGKYFPRQGNSPADYKCFHALRILFIFYTGV